MANNGNDRSETLNVCDLDCSHKKISTIGTPKMSMAVGLRTGRWGKAAASPYRHMEARGRRPWDTSMTGAWDTGG